MDVWPSSAMLLVLALVAYVASSDKIDEAAKAAGIGLIPDIVKYCLVPMVTAITYYCGFCCGTPLQHEVFKQALTSRKASLFVFFPSLELL
jgi:hypothetical protein